MESPIVFGWMNLEMIKLDDCHANLQSFHELAKLFYGISFYGLFITLVSRVVWFKEHQCLSQMNHNINIGGI